MKTFRVLQLFFLATLVATNQASVNVSAISHRIHLLRAKLRSHVRPVPAVSCLSWRLGVETHNIIEWKTVPAACAGYVRHYMLGYQYRKDSKAVTYQAYLYVNSLNLTKDGKNLWIFDIDETTLSNLPYYAHHGFGVKVFNPTSFNNWVSEGRAPAVPENLKLYRKLLALGIKVAFLTGRPGSYREVTETNLKKAGYHTWEMVILKGSFYSDYTSRDYKSSERKKLEKKKYRIIGNMGDQWSDLLGINPGNRTFKVPNPMYYVR